ncbi:efflux RND transporter periplasmic adaptor subunit [Candidatus Woesebacteria bacterium]|nr:efflux RND transporter periplasmic adaptor subunit [Candidatus Woesebacteria bacterium]
MNPLQFVVRQLSRFKIFFLQASLLVKIIIIAIFGVVGWYIYSHYFVQTEDTVQYQTAKVEKGTLTVSVTSSGQVSSTNNAAVTTQSSGVITTIYATNGTSVNAGDKIAEITLDQQGQQKYMQALSSYQSAQNSLASAKTKKLTLQAMMFDKWDTFKELAESGTYQNSDGTPNYQNRALPEFHIPEKEWLAAEADYKNQEKIIAQSQTALSSSWYSLQQSSPVIYSPIAGTVTGLSLQGGTVLAAKSSSSSIDTSVSSNQVASIVTEANPSVTVNLTEIDVIKVTVGDKATITLDAFPDKTYTGKILSIDTVGSISSGVTQYPVVIALDVTNPHILPNMSASATIITDTKTNVLMVPVSTVTTVDGISTVKVIKNGTPADTTVTTGLSSDTHTEIISGLSEGDTVVTGAVSASTSSTTQSSPFSPFGNRSGGAVRVTR